VQIGFIGLGKMGGSMVNRIRRDSDHEVVAFDYSSDAVGAAEEHGASGAGSLEALIARLSPGDMIVDGGNCKWSDSVARHAKCAEHDVRFVDVGTSGGVWGLEIGYCMMVGGDDESVRRLSPILDVLAPPDGWGHMGGHNGIEYGLMQSYAEGFELMHNSDFGLDNEQIATLWSKGSVIRSWLLELAAQAFEADGNDLESLEGWVDDSGEGRWTLDAGIATDTPMPTLAAALFARFGSRGAGNYSARMVAALRNQFGGYAVKTAPKT
jgi:6-phosphogluconate dehydrogenase